MENDVAGAPIGANPSVKPQEEKEQKDSVGQRFQRAMESVYGYSRYGADLAREYNMTTQAVSQYGKKKKSTDMMRKIAADKGVSLPWLEFGAGEMMETREPAPRIRENLCGIDGILGRMRLLLGVKTDKEMCDTLEINYSTLDNWKSRDYIPYRRLTEIANKLGVPVVWLQHGDHDDKSAPASSQWYMRLKEIRERRNLTQSELGRMLDKDATAVNRYESGAIKTLSRALRKELARVFSIEEADYIATGEAPPADNNTEIPTFGSNEADPDELVILEKYRELSDAKKDEALIAILKAIMEVKWK